MKVLSLSDKVSDRIYRPGLKERFPDVDLVLGCGDLPYYYLEFVVDSLNVPVFFVRGNHANLIEYSESGDRKKPGGAIDLHRKMVNHKGILMLGFEGCLRYRKGPFMYTEREMWKFVLGIAPKLLWNKIRYGRYLDILVTHAPSFGINDQEDRVHQGFKALRWLVEKFKPAYHFHGHVHVYDRNQQKETLHGETIVINAYGYQKTEIDVDAILDRESEVRK